MTFGGQTSAGDRGTECLVSRSNTEAYHERIVGHSQDVTFIPHTFHHVLPDEIILAHNLQQP